MSTGIFISTDQMDEAVKLSSAPKRIISLVPSQTELLIDLGLHDELIGRTKFCIHPAEAVRQIPIIGATKKFRFDKIDQLKPDLIIGNKEENYKEGIDQLKQQYPVWMSDIFNLSDALAMIRSVGDLVGKTDEASKIIDRIESGFSQIKPAAIPPKAVYMIWNKPYMAAGKNTFIDDMLSKAGFTNAVSQLRYPELSLTEIKELKPDVVMLSSEPFPFKEHHKNELSELLNSKVMLVDGEMFSWYGSRLIKATQYFKRLQSDL